MKPDQIAKTMSEMMDNWNKIEKIVRHLFPDATEEETYQKTKAMMDLAVQIAIERTTN